MIELLVLIIGLVIVWKFSSSLNAAATASEEASKKWSEGIIKDVVIERQELMMEFNDDLAKLKEKGHDGKIVTHEDLMSKFGIKK
jgi:hypothetical protein